MKNKDISIVNAIKYGFGQYLENLGYYFKVMLLCILLIIGIIILYVPVLTILSIFLTFLISIFTNPRGIVYGTAFYLIFFIFYFANYISKYFFMSFIIDSELSTKKPKISLRQIFKNQRWQFIWVRTKYNLRVLSGLILLIIPGVYWYFQYYFRGYLFLENNTTDKEDLITVPKISSGNRFKLFLYDSIFFITSHLFNWLFTGAHYNNYSDLPYNVSSHSAIISLLTFLIFWPPWVLGSVLIYKQISQKNS